jgi:putative transposase
LYGGDAPLSPDTGPAAWREASADSSRVERPDQLWDLDMTSVWVAEHGWVYLMAAIDCCTRKITAWHLETRCRAREAITLIEQAAAERAIAPGTLTLGTDNGSAHRARIQDRPARSRDRAPARRVPRPREPGVHRELVRKLNERCIWREEFETLEQARQAIGDYVTHYPHRPHSRLNYNTPLEVAATWRNGQDHLTPAA